MRFLKVRGLIQGPGLAALLAAMILACPSPSRAGMILSLVPNSPTVAAGSTNNVLQLQLTNTGGNTPNSSNVAAASFDLKTTNPNIVFTLATTATAAPYIFPSSLFGPTISSTTGQELTGSDEDSTFTGVTVGASPVGIAKIFFNVLGDASAGMFNITFDPGGTSFTDGNSGLNYTSLTLPSTTITITAANPIPEPGTLGMGITGAALAGGWAFCRSRQKRTPAGA